MSTSRDPLKEAEARVRALTREVGSLREDLRRETKRRERAVSQCQEAEDARKGIEHKAHELTYSNRKLAAEVEAAHAAAKEAGERDKRALRMLREGLAEVETAVAQRAERGNLQLAGVFGYVNTLRATLLGCDPVGGEAVLPQELANKVTHMMADMIRSLSALSALLTNEPEAEVQAASALSGLRSASAEQQAAGGRKGGAVSVFVKQPPLDVEKEKLKDEVQRLRTQMRTFLEEQSGTASASALALQSQLRDKTAVAEAVQADLKVQLKEREADVRSLQAQLQKQVHSKKVEAKGVHAQLLESLHEQIAEKDALRAEVEARQVCLDAAEAISKEATAANNALTSEVRVQTARAQEAEARIKELEAQLAEQTARAEASREEVADLHRAVQALGQEGKALRAELERVLERQRTTEAAGARDATTAEDSRALHAAALEHVQALQQKVAALESSEATAVKQADHVQALLQEREAQLANKVKHLAALQASMAAQNADMTRALSLVSQGHAHMPKTSTHSTAPALFSPSKRTSTHSPASVLFPPTERATESRLHAPALLSSERATESRLHAPALRPQHHSSPPLSSVALPLHSPSAQAEHPRLPSPSALRPTSPPRHPSPSALLRPTSPPRHPSPPITLPDTGNPAQELQQLLRLQQERRSQLQLPNTSQPSHSSHPCALISPSLPHTSRPVGATSAASQLHLSHSSHPSAINSSHPSTTPSIPSTAPSTTTTTTSEGVITTHDGYGGSCSTIIPTRVNNGSRSPLQSRAAPLPFEGAQQRADASRKIPGSGVSSSALITPHSTSHAATHNTHSFTNKENMPGLNSSHLNSLNNGLNNTSSSKRAQDKLSQASGLSEKPESRLHSLVDQLRSSRAGSVDGSSSKAGGTSVHSANRSALRQEGAGSVMNGKQGHEEGVRGSSFGSTTIIGTAEGSGVSDIGALRTAVPPGSCVQTLGNSSIGRNTALAMDGSSMNASIGGNTALATDGGSSMNASFNRNTSLVTDGSSALGGGLKSSMNATAGGSSMNASFGGASAATALGHTGGSSNMNASLGRDSMNTTAGGSSTNGGSSVSGATSQRQASLASSSAVAAAIAARLRDAASGGSGVKLGEGSVKGNDGSAKSIEGSVKASSSVLEKMTLHPPPASNQGAGRGAQGYDAASVQNYGAEPSRGVAQQAAGRVQQQQQRGFEAAWSPVSSSCDESSLGITFGPGSMAAQQGTNLPSKEEPTKSFSFEFQGAAEPAESAGSEAESRQSEDLQQHMRTLDQEIELLGASLRQAGGVIAS